MESNSRTPLSVVDALTKNLHQYTDKELEELKTKLEAALRSVQREILRREEAALHEELKAKRLALNAQIAKIYSRNDPGSGPDMAKSCRRRLGRPSRRRFGRLFRQLRRSFRDLASVLQDQLILLTKELHLRFQH